MVRGRKGEYEALLDDLAKQGFARARVDGEIVELSERAALNLARYEQHTIEVVVDRLVRRDDIRQRLTESMETALRLTDGIAEIGVVDEDGAEELLTFSEHLACTFCGISFDEPAPRNFSFNSPYGACPTCDGLGTQFEVDPDLVVPDPTQSLDDGAIAPWTGATAAGSTGSSTPSPSWRLLARHAVGEAAQGTARSLLYGAGTKQVHVRYRNRYGRQRSFTTHFEGIVPWLKRRHGESDSDSVREWTRDLHARGARVPTCNGARLKPESLAVTVGGSNIFELCSLSIAAVDAEVDALELTEREHLIADRVFREVRARLQFLLDVGLDYLSLARSAATLSGGEAQRIRLASQIGSGWWACSTSSTSRPSGCTSATTSGCSTP